MQNKIAIPLAGAIIMMTIIIGLGIYYFYSDIGKKDMTKLTQTSQPKVETKNKQIPTRDQIAEQHKWNLGDMYATDADWEKDFQKIETEYLPKFSDYHDQLNNIQKLLACLKLADQTFMTLEKMNVYSSYKQTEDLSNAQASEMNSRNSTLRSKAGAVTAFMDPELIELPTDYLQSLTKNPDFRNYWHYFDTLTKRKGHVLSGPQEELLAKSQDLTGTFSNVFDKATAADIKFSTIKNSSGEDIQVSEAKYLSLLMDPDRNFRQRAATSMMAGYDSFKNALAENLNGQIKSNIFYAQTKKYNNALEAALATEFIPETVYNNLITTIDENLSPLHKFIALRKKVLKLDQIHGYDLYVPLVADINQDIPYETGKKMIIDALAILGADYTDILKQGLENRWVDVYETKNKESGASAWSAYGYHPYVKMNYDNNIDDVSTLAHELGHAVNFWYSQKEQPYPTSSYTVFNAEVASTANELLMTRYLINNAKNDEEKLFYLNQLATTIYRTLYTQTMYSQFEKLIHNRVENGEALSVDSLNQIWSDLIVKYDGPNYVIDDFYKIGWARIPHFYYNFYVYKYATAISAANQLVKNISDNQPGAREKYIEFLSAGSSDYPVELLKKAGVDMTTSEPIKNLIRDFDKIVDQMEIILQKQGKI